MSKNHEKLPSEYEEYDDLNLRRSDRENRYSSRMGKRSKVNTTPASMRGKRSALREQSKARVMTVYRPLTQQGSSTLLGIIGSLAEEHPSLRRGNMRLSYLSPVKSALLLRDHSKDERANFSSALEYNNLINEYVNNLGQERNPFEAQLGKFMVVSGFVNSNSDNRKYYVAAGFTGESRTRIIDERNSMVASLVSTGVRSRFIPHVTTFAMQDRELGREIRDVLNESINPNTLVELGRLTTNKQLIERLSVVRLGE